MEADIIGMDLAARACFDPAAGKHVFTRLGEIEKRMGADKTPSLLRTHPVSTQRVEAIQEHLPKALTWYEREGCPVGGQPAYSIFSPRERPAHLAPCALCAAKAACSGSR